MDVQLALYALKGSINYFLEKTSQDGYKKIIADGLGAQNTPEVVDYLIGKVKVLDKSINGKALKYKFIPDGIAINEEQALVITAVGYQSINLCVDILDELLSNPQLFINSDNDFLKSYLSYMSALLTGNYQAISPTSHSYPISKIELAYTHEFRRLVNEYKFLKRRNLEWLIEIDSTNTLMKSLNNYFSSKEKDLHDLRVSIDDSLSAEKKEIRNQSTELDSLVKNIKSGYGKDREETKSLIVKIQAVFDEYKSNYTKLIEDMENSTHSIKNRGAEIDSILQMANQYGMASSFQKRVKELALPRLGWLGVFAASIVALVLISYYVIVPEVNFIEKSSFLSVFKHLPITLPVIWAAWFSSKQYNQMSKLKEDYEYKYAVAMAYHGYKKEAMELNNEMHSKLLESILVHFSDNPVRLYESSESSTPIEALLKNDKLSDLIKSIRS